MNALEAEICLRKRVKSRLRLATTVDERFDELIYVDVSNCIVESVPREVDTYEVAEREIKKALRGFLIRNEYVVEALNQKHLDGSYATCLIATLPIWTHDSVMETASCTEVRAATGLSNEKYEELQRVLHGFDQSFTRLVGPKVASLREVNG